MDIKLTYSSIKRFLTTNIGPEELAEKVSLCGPTFDRIHKIGKDTVFDIEAITNRVDTASAFGVAREANAILNQFAIATKLKANPYGSKISLHKNLPDNVKINISNPQLAPRFCAITLKNVKIGPSEKKTQELLEAVGERPINNAVDITNELTLLYGFPSHIFDLDKIKDKTMNLRLSRQGERITLLDDSHNTLKGGDIVIENTDGKLIDLCGIMGGSLAEVDDETKNILLIIPFYQSQRIRTTSLYLQKRTMAAQIYEKSPDRELCLPVLDMAIKLFAKRCKASPSSKVFDYYPKPLPEKFVDLDLVWLSSFVGITIARETIIEILTDLGFTGKFVSYHKLRCKVPSWRYFDINIKEDLAEEVTRVYGYYKLPSVIPFVELGATTPNKLLTQELKAKKYLSDIGFAEVYNNSLTSADLIETAGLFPKDHLKLRNALSEDYEYLRTSLLPGLLTNFKDNLDQSGRDINIYELSNVYLKTGNTLPDEHSTLGFVTTKDIRQAKGIVQSLAKHLNLPPVSYVTATRTTTTTGNLTAAIKVGTEMIGSIGPLEPGIARTLDIKRIPVLCQIDFVKMTSLIKENYTYIPRSNYPSMFEDITITSKIPVGELISKIKNIDPLITDVTYLDSFENKHTFRLDFTSYQDNLDQKTVSKIKQRISKSLSD